MDDDGSGAFSHMKCALLCIAMHTSLQSGYGVFYTGGTFGDNTSPSNFDPIALARRQLAQAIWQTVHNGVDLVKSYLPPLNLAPVLAPGEVATFTQADPDSINSGVLAADGTRKSPPYNMHVDDSLYAYAG